MTYGKSKGRPKEWMEPSRNLGIYGPPWMLDLIHDLGYKTPGTFLFVKVKEEFSSKSSITSSHHTWNFYREKIDFQDGLERQRAQERERQDEENYCVMDKYAKSILPSSVEKIKGCIDPEIKIKCLESVLDEIEKRYQVRPRLAVLIRYFNRNPA